MGIACGRNQLLFGQPLPSSYLPLASNAALPRSRASPVFLSPDRAEVRRRCDDMLAPQLWAFKKQSDLRLPLAPCGNLSVFDAAGVPGIQAIARTCRNLECNAGTATISRGYLRGQRANPTWKTALAQRITRRVACGPPPEHPVCRDRREPPRFQGRARPHSQRCLR